MNINININVDSKFTEAIIFLATSLGYPGDTVGLKMKKTLKDRQTEEVKKIEESNEPEPGPSHSIEDITEIMKSYVKNFSRENLITFFKTFSTEAGSPVEKLSQLLKKDYDSFFTGLKMRLEAKDAEETKAPEETKDAEETKAPEETFCLSDISNICLKSMEDGILSIDITDILSKFIINDKPAKKINDLTKEQYKPFVKELQELVKFRKGEI